MPAFGDTVELLAGTPVTDPYSGEVTGISWKTPTVVETWHGVTVDFTKTSDSEQVGRTPVYSGLTLHHVPVDSAVSAHSRVRVRGLVYEVDGEIADPVNPFTGTRYGKTVNLKRVTG